MGQAESLLQNDSEALEGETVQTEKMSLSSGPGVPCRALIVDASCTTLVLGGSTLCGQWRPDNGARRTVLQVGHSLVVTRFSARDQLS